MAVWSCFLYFLEMYVESYMDDRTMVFCALGAAMVFFILINMIQVRYRLDILRRKRGTPK